MSKLIEETKVFGWFIVTRTLHIFRSGVGVGNIDHAINFISINLYCICIYINSQILSFGLPKSRVIESEVKLEISEFNPESSRSPTARPILVGS